MQPTFFLSLALGVGLAAATGFRVFMPLFILGLAVRAGLMPASAGFEWVGSNAAILMFAVAAVTEVIAYYVPVLDNALDAITGPLAVLAGMGVMAMALGDAPPMLKWSLAIIAGGGIAAATQGTTTLARGLSTAATMGLGNPVVATGEIIAAIFFSVLAIALPYLALGLVALLVIFGLRTFLQRRAARAQ